MNSVLIIDDDKELCSLMKKCVEQENLSAVVAHGGLEGLRLLGENRMTLTELARAMNYKGITLRMRKAIHSLLERREIMESFEGRNLYYSKYR